MSDLTITASAAGAVLNSNLATGGGTDDTAVLQGVLDNSSDGVSHTTLIMDGPALITGLNVYSNTTIDATAGGGFFLKANSDRSAIMGATPSKTVRTDHDITLQNFYLNGNGANQADTSADGSFVLGILFYSALRLTLSGLHIHDSRVWGVGIWNTDTVSISNHTHTLQTQRLTQDAIDIRPNCSNVTITNVTLTSYDDAIALNAIDYAGLDPIPPYATEGGPITNVTIDGVNFKDCLMGIDLLSKSYLIDNVVIRNVSGRVTDYWLSITSYPVVVVPGSGNFGTIEAHDVNVSTFGAPVFTGAPYNLNEHVHLEANINSLTLDNCVENNIYDLKPYIRLFTGFTVDDFTLSVNPTSGKLNAQATVLGTISNKIGAGWLAPACTP